MTKDLKYWQERGGQIEWRLAEAESVVEKIKKDLKECDDNIARLNLESARKEGVECSQ